MYWTKILAEIPPALIIQSKEAASLKLLFHDNPAWLPRHYIVLHNVSSKMSDDSIHADLLEWTKDVFVADLSAMQVKILKSSFEVQ